MSQKHIIDTRRFPIQELRKQIDSNNNTILNNYFFPRLSSQYRMIAHTAIATLLGTVFGLRTYKTTLNRAARGKYTHTFKYFLGSLLISSSYYLSNEVYYGIFNRMQLFKPKYFYTNSCAGVSSFAVYYGIQRAMLRNRSRGLFKQTLKYCLVLTVCSMFVEVYIEYKRYIINNNILAFVQPAPGQKEPIIIKDVEDPDDEEDVEQLQWVTDTYLELDQHLQKQLQIVGVVYENFRIGNIVECFYRTKNSEERQKH